MRWLDEFRTGPLLSVNDKTDKTTFQDFRRTKDKSPVPKMGVPLTDKTDESLEVRLSHHGISIAIDRPTGEACLIFRPDVERVRKAHAARFVSAVSLTPKQRREILDSLDYFESLEERYGRQ